MCYNCGCGVPSDDMGDKNNITDQMLSELASKKKSNLEKLKEELYQELSKDSKNISKDYESILQTAADSWGQSVDEAKKETLSLLKKQLKK